MEGPLEGIDSLLNEIDHQRTPDACIPVFYKRVVPDLELTEKTGKQQFKELDWIDIVIPGNEREKVSVAVLQEHKDRFAKQWARYEAGEESRPEGFPVMEWPQISRAMAKTLEADKVFTVEQLSQLPDQNLMELGPGYLELKYRAVKWLEFMNESVTINQLADQLRQRDERIAILEQKVEDLGRETEHRAPAAAKVKPPTAKAKAK
jgi:hypothetical protein